MPRRPPGEIRAQLPYRVNRGSRVVIRGLSSSANRQIAQFEKKNRLYPGEVAYAIRVWAEILRRESPRAEPSCEYETTGWRDMHARTLLEAVLHNVSPKARRELVTAMGPLDSPLSRPHGQ
jgi:hypothetical protein